MKKLILVALFCSFPLMAQVQEISDREIKNKFLSVVKDAEVENLLTKTGEFNDCRKDNEVSQTDTPAQRDTKIAKATDCFKKKLTNKSPQQLQELSKNLGLSEYGLVKSKNVSDITDYLSKKMTKSLTGRDPDEKDPKKIKEQLLFKNQKILDHKIFIELYTSQLMKAALFETSRFCFENLRNTANTTKDNFIDHWNTVTTSKPTNMIYRAKKDANGKDVYVDGKQVTEPDPAYLTDDGQPSFFKIANANADLTKQSDAYKEIMNGITSGGKPLNPQELGDFYEFCMKALPVLCEEFKKDTVVTQSLKNESTDIPKVSSSTKMTKGANACLTLDRIRSIRTALKNTEKVQKQFEDMHESNDKIGLLLRDPVKFYLRGKGANEDSLDEISNIASTDMLADDKNTKDLNDKIDNCKNNPGDTECAEYLVENDGLEASINNVEYEMNLKREMEKKRVSELAKDKKKLDEYLLENGYFDIIEKLKANPNLNIEDEVAKVFDARKVATIQGLKLKVGKRQITKEEGDQMKSSDKQTRMLENMQDSRNERARLAQVVMFNNIITSQLELTEKGTNNKGRNVNAWKVEQEALDNSTAGINPTLFQGLKEAADKEGSKFGEASVVGGGIIDTILGSTNKD